MKNQLRSTYIHTALTLLAILLIATHQAKADGVICIGESQIGSYLESPARQVAVEGAVTCIVSYDWQIRVLDTSDPADPKLLSTIQLWTGHDNYVEKLSVVDSLLYVSQDVDLGFSFMYVYDLSDPTDPVQLSERLYQNGLGDFSVQGHLVYIKTGTHVEVYDYSDPTTPIMIGSVDANSGTSMGASGEFLYTQSGSYLDPVLAVIDISDPTAPTYTGEVPVSGYIRSIAPYGNTVYAAVNGKLIIIDATDQTQPLITGEMVFEGYIQDLDIHANRIVLMLGNSGAKVLDIASPLSPQSLGGFNPPVSANECELVGTTAYIATDSGGLHILDISYPLNGTPWLGEFDFHSANIKGVAISGQYAYAVENDDGLIILDVSDPTAPIAVGSVDIDSNSWRVSLAESIAYVGTGASVIAIDINDPTNPTVIGIFPLPFSGNTIVMDLVGTTVYVKNYYDTQLRVIDFSNPASPVELNIGLDLDPAVGVSFEHDRMYLNMSGSGIHAYDNSDQTNPILLGIYPVETGYFRDVVVSNNLAYIPTYVSPPIEVMQIVDFADPASPELITTIPTTDRVTNHSVVDGKLYMSVFYYGLDVLDISEPTNPEFLGYTMWGTDDFAIDGTIGYFATGYAAGLQILDMSACPTCPADLTNDGSLNFLDVSAFLTAFGSSNPIADFNQDGLFNFLDVSAFLNAFAAGCP